MPTILQITSISIIILFAIIGLVSIRIWIKQDYRVVAALLWMGLHSWIFTKFVA